MKQYAIVRVDNSCPAMSDGLGCIISRNMFHCKCGEDIKNYGDTKEQLIRKVAQPLFQREIELWYEHFPDEKPDKEITETLYKNCIEQATKIVEFLGVE